MTTTKAMEHVVGSLVSAQPLACKLASSWIQRCGPDHVLVWTVVVSDPRQNTLDGVQVILRELVPLDLQGWSSPERGCAARRQKQCEACRQPCGEAGREVGPAYSSCTPRRNQT
eukprot:129507-Rhodomonas_salina.1